jgi:hypothetical protein
MPLQQRFDLLFDSLLVEPADAIDLRSQVSNLVFIADLSLSLMADQVSEKIIAQGEIAAGRHRATCCCD